MMLNEALSATVGSTQREQPAKAKHWEPKEFPGVTSVAEDLASEVSPNLGEAEPAIAWRDDSMRTACCSNSPHLISPCEKHTTQLQDL